MASGRRTRRQHGMVTVELAVGIMTAAMLTTALAGLSVLGIAQAAAAESSAQIARQTARGDAAGVAAARDRAPGGASVEVVPEAGGVTVTVSIPMTLPVLGGFQVHAEAWAAYEPGVDG